jgi:polyhydroxybutyrate depolymerase
MLSTLRLVVGRWWWCALWIGLGCAESAGQATPGVIGGASGFTGGQSGAGGTTAGVGGAGGVGGVDTNPIGGAAGSSGMGGAGSVGGVGSPIGGVGAAGGTMGGIGAVGGDGMTGGTSGGAGGSRPPGEPCTGKTGGTGDVSRTWNGIAQYITHYPPGLDPNTPVPLVFVAHGFTMSGAVMQTLTNFDAVADRDKFVVVYPDGDGGAFPWDVGVGACAPGGLISAGAAESLRGYLDGMRAAVEEDQCIDAGAIFVTGFSMGGYFSHHVGCQRGNEFARAVGPCSGGTYPGECPGAPVPVFIMHGATDTFIDHTLCGQGARDMWLPRNGCGAMFDTKMVGGGHCDWYKDCDPNGQTVYCEFDGVGHSWASGATDAVWSFFKGYL